MSAEQSGANDKRGNETPPRPEDIETPFFNRATGPDSSLAGAIIGPYHLLQLLGHGGMGDVWLAEQKQPVRRRVAIKRTPFRDSSQQPRGQGRVRIVGVPHLVERQLSKSQLPIREEER